MYAELRADSIVAPHCVCVCVDTHGIIKLEKSTSLMKIILFQPNNAIYIACMYIYMALPN